MSYYLTTSSALRGWPFGPSAFPSLSSFFDDLPSYRWTDTDNSLSLSLDLPGFKKDQVSIEVSDNTLRVQAKSGKRSVSESFSLGSDIDVPAITATLEDGVLVLDLPRVATPTSKKTVIQVK